MDAGSLWPRVPPNYPMSNLVLPPHVQAQIDREKRRERNARILRNVTIEDARAREFTEKLQRISPDLYMVKANDKVEMGAPLRPGFYHILMRSADGEIGAMEVHENGRYAEPDSRIFDVLARGNLRERRVRERLAQQHEQEQEEIAKEKQTAKENRMERVRDIVLSATRAQVSMNDSVPWTQNVSGKRPK